MDRETAAGAEAERVEREKTASAQAERVDRWVLIGLVYTAPVIGALAGLTYIGCVTHLPAFLGGLPGYKPLASAGISYFVVVIVLSLVVAVCAAKLNNSCFETMYFSQKNFDEWIWRTLGNLLFFAGFFFGCRQFVFTSSNSFLQPLGVPLSIYCFGEFVLVILSQFLFSWRGI